MGNERPLNDVSTDGPGRMGGIRPGGDASDPGGLGRRASERAVASGTDGLGSAIEQGWIGGPPQGVRSRIASNDSATVSWSRPLITKPTSARACAPVGADGLAAGQRDRESGPPWAQIAGTGGRFRSVRTRSRLPMPLGLRCPLRSKRCSLAPSSLTPDASISSAWTAAHLATAACKSAPVSAGTARLNALGLQDPRIPPQARSSSQTDVSFPTTRAMIDGSR